VETPIDYSSLTNPVDPAEVDAFKKDAQARLGAYAPPEGLRLAIAIIGIVFIAGFFVTTSFTIAGVFLSSLRDSMNPVTLIFTSFFGFIVLGAIALAVWGIVKSLSGTNTWEKWMRASRFAEANGFTFSRRDANPNYPGLIFTQGRNRAALDHYRSATGRFLDIGTMRYITGSGKNQATHNRGFMALNLDRALPNMVLDAKANNLLFGASNLPALFSKDQVLHLEGNFDDYFTLYCPKEYERDALYVFTPDLMALLIDTTAPFDVEIVDNWMFVYTGGAINPIDAPLLHRLLLIVDTVGAKTLKQSARYADERVGDAKINAVAPQGRRLRRRTSLVVLIFVVVWALGWLLPHVLVLFS
jgi:hypothetical protein